MTNEFLAELGGPRTVPTRRPSPPLIGEASSSQRRRYNELRHHHFVERQGLFNHSDLDRADRDDTTIVLVATGLDGDVVGGVRVNPVDIETAWWAGSRLITAPNAPLGVGAALVRAACARVEAEGALRFDATVQADKARFFARLGWQDRDGLELGGMAHRRMTWPIKRLEALASHKRSIGAVLGSANAEPGGPAWVGDDGTPVPGTDVVAVHDSILGVMVERDPWWAGWCSVLVNANDLAAMGATAVGLLDGLTAPTEDKAREVFAGIADGANAWGVDILGGHTQIGGHSSLSLTMLGRVGAAGPVPGGGAAPGHHLSVIADLGGRWRPGYQGRQWDSTSERSPAELQAMHRIIGRLAPAAAKDVSMAGLVGTVAMMAEASGAGATVSLDRIPRPTNARPADWLTCFPGYAMVVATDEPIAADHPAVADAPVVVTSCGMITDEPGVRLEWPDGATERVIAGPVTGLPATSGLTSQLAGNPNSSPTRNLASKSTDRGTTPT